MMSSQEQECRIKRSRVPNFTGHEKSLLARLISQRKDIIESKLTDGKTIARKKDAWLLVEREFNAEPNVYKRDLLVLKRAWDNLKAVTRKLRAQQRGLKVDKASPEQPPGPKQEDILNMVEEATGSSLNCEVYNNFDSDEVSIENTPMSNEQSGNETVNSNILDPEVIVYEANSPNKTDSLHTSGAKPSLHARRANHYLQREAALRLKSLQLKSKLESQILSAKLKTALLQQQEAEVRLEVARLELENKRNVMKPEL